MLKLRQGCPEAFDCLVRRHQQAALQTALRLLGDASEAEDAVQSAFLGVYRNRERYQCQGFFRAYLFRAVLNEARLKLRRSRRQQAALHRLEDAYAVHPAGSTPAADDRRLHHALARLPLRQRTVIVLRFSADLSLDDIARTLRLPLGTIKSRLFGGLRRLRQEYQGEDE